MIIDISKYQNKIAWQEITGVDGVYIKATEGVGYIDQQLKSHEAGALFKNIPIGFYHFATLNSTNIISDSTAEAMAFYEATKGIKTGLPFVLDIEKNVLNLKPELVLQWIENFIKVMAEKGINDVVIYSYSPFLNANLPKGHKLGAYKLWIAAYAPAYQLPNGWNKAWLWQYSQKGVVNGITGNVDVSKYV